MDKWIGAADDGMFYCDLLEPWNGSTRQDETQLITALRAAATYLSLVLILLFAFYGIKKFCDQKFGVGQEEERTTLMGYIILLLYILVLVSIHRELK